MVTQHTYAELLRLLHAVEAQLREVDEISSKVEGLNDILNLSGDGFAMQLRTMKAALQRAINALVAEAYDHGILGWVE